MIEFVDLSITITSKIETKLAKNIINYSRNSE